MCTIIPFPRRQDRSARSPTADPGADPAAPLRAAVQKLPWSPRQRAAFLNHVIGALRAAGARGSTA
jgi:hypothetical protein